MLERWITALHTEDAGLEEPAATRDRLKEIFPKGATRRMTQLGMLVGASLEAVASRADDTLVYASSYAETRAIEGYLDSFPAASPTLFQTSIHPSAVQQALIVRQRPLREFIPLTGGAALPAQALRVAMLAHTPRAILCAGEERGTWLLERHCASDRAFAFALVLSSSPENALGRVALDALHVGQTSAPSNRLDLPDLFDLFLARRPFDGVVAPAHRLSIEWTT